MSNNQADILGFKHENAASPRARLILLSQRSSPCFVTVTVGLGIFTDSFLYSVMIPVLPYILNTRQDIHSDQEVQLWISGMVAAYGVALLVASPLIGWIADNSQTRQRPYISSLLLLFAAALMLCFGRSVVVLILARVLQGISATTVWVVGLALLVDTVGSEHAGRAMGFAALGSSLAILIGPLIGGVVYERVGFNGIFYICFPLMFIDLLMRLVLIEKDKADQWLELNCTRSAFHTTKPCTSIELEEASRKQRKNVILELLTCQRLLCAVFSTLVSATLLASFEAVIPSHVRMIFGWSSTNAGLSFAAVIIPNLISPVIGWLSDLYGARWIVSSGFLMFCPILIGLRFVDSNGSPQIILFCGLLFGLGVCYSMVVVPILSEYTAVITERERLSPGVVGSRGAYAQAYGLYNIAYSGGILLGPVSSGLLIQKFGWSTMTLGLGILCGISAIVTAVFCGYRRQSPDTWECCTGVEVTTEV